MAGINTHRSTEVDNTYYDIATYVYRLSAQERECRCVAFWKFLQPCQSGFMSKTNDSLTENMVKVDIFTWDDMRALVGRMDPSVVEQILNCFCTVCRRVQFLHNTRACTTRVLLSGEIISDIQQLSDEGVRIGGPKAVLFGMLCYLGTPFMLHFDLWRDSSRSSGTFGLVRFQLDQPDVLDCFRRLAELRDISTTGGSSGSGDSEHLDINIQATEFILAFQQVERQFQPLKLSPEIEALKVPGDAIFPFDEFQYRKSGGQARIYVTKIVEKFSRDLKTAHKHSTDDQTFVCKVIETRHDEGHRCGVGEAADYEKMGMVRMKTVNHPNLIQMYFWFDYLNTRVFLLPCYHGDLDDLLRGTFDHRKFNPRQEQPFDMIGSQSYSFPAEGWLWKGVLGILDGLRHFHGSHVNPGNQAAHLDLKPSNILISSAGDIVISDCGTSRVTHEYHPSVTTQRFVGTTAYSPPWSEQRIGFSNPQPKLNQSFDVWSMGCILLEVLIFIMQGTRGIEQFRTAKGKTDIHGREISHSGPTSTFWYFESRQHNIFKLKSVVAEWLNRADAMSLFTEENTGPLSKLAIRLRIMFKFDPSERGTIEDCLNSLQEDQVAVGGLHQPPQSVWPITSIGHGLRPLLDAEQELESILNDTNTNLFGGDEFGYRDILDPAHRDIPKKLSKLSLTYLRGREDCPCRIRVFENRSTGIVSISTAFVLQGRVVLEELTLQRARDFLFQRNLFDVNPPGSVTGTGAIWGFTGLHQHQRFKMRDLTSYMVIQEVLLGQQYISGSHFQLDACVLKPWTRTYVFSEKSIIVQIARVEVWIEVPDEEKTWLPLGGHLGPRHTHALSTTSSYASGSSGSSYASERSGSRSHSQNPFQFQHPSAAASTKSSEELALNPRLVIYRKHEDSVMNVDCLTILLRGKRIILQEKLGSDKVVSIVPNTLRGMKHAHIQYHRIPLGTQQQPKGFSLRSGWLHSIEEGDGEKAEVINLQFPDAPSLQRFKKTFQNRGFLRDYFAE